MAKNGQKTAIAPGGWGQILLESDPLISSLEDLWFTESFIFIKRLKPHCAETYIGSFPRDMWILNKSIEDTRFFGKKIPLVHKYKPHEVRF